MALHFRQQKAYTDTCDVYRASRTNTAGLVSDDSWARVVTGLPCLYVWTQNDDDPVGVGRMKRRTMLTEDLLLMEVGANVRSGDYVRLTTTGALQVGTIHRVMGAPKQTPDRGVRKANEQIAQLMEDEKASVTLGF